MNMDEPMGAPVWGQRAKLISNSSSCEGVVQDENWSEGDLGTSDTNDTGL